jgi:hypothetical protein
MKLNAQGRKEVANFLNEFCNNRSVIPQAMKEAWQYYDTHGMFLLTLRGDEIKPDTGRMDELSLILGREEMESG